MTASQAPWLSPWVGDEEAVIDGLVGNLCEGSAAVEEGGRGKAFLAHRRQLWWGYGAGLMIPSSCSLSVAPVLHKTVKQLEIADLDNT
ncbi:MAG TPA: hypothetical protein VF148_04355 [Acidimicrobiia bacterium]